MDNLSQEWPIAPAESVSMPASVPQQQNLQALAKGIAIYSATNIGTRILNFALLPLFTRFLTPSDYGIISLSEIVATLVISVAMLGLDSGMQRLYFQFSEYSAAQKDYVSSILSSEFGLLGVAIALSFSTGAFLSAHHKLSVPFFPYIALAIGAAALVQLPQSALVLLRFRFQSRTYAALSIGQWLSTATGTLLLVVLFPMGAKGWLIGKLLGTVIAAAVAVVLIREWFSHKWSFGSIRETLPIALPMVPHQLMALGLVVADRFLLVRYRTLDQVGIYSLSYTCGMAMFLVTTSVVQAFEPVFFDLNRDKDKFSDEIAHLTSKMAELLTCIALLGVLISPAFARLMDVRYRELQSLVPLVIAGYLFHGVFALLQLVILQSKRSKFILYASSIALIVNLGLNFLWIPRWGMYGAAYATIAGYAVEAAIAYKFAQQLNRLRYERSGILAAAAVLLCSIAIIQLTRQTKFRDGLLAALGVTILFWIWNRWSRMNEKYRLKNIDGCLPGS